MKKRRLLRPSSIDRPSQKSDTQKGEESKPAKLHLYQESTGRVPFLVFFSARKNSEKADIRAGLSMLREKGHQLRPPLNEHLGDQIFYLRISSTDGTYRIFYWPHGKGILILGHGFSKKSRKCPPEEIKRAKKCRDKFRKNPQIHIYEGQIDENQNEA